MADETNVAEAASAPALPADTGAISVTDAASAIGAWRAKQAEPATPKPPRAPNGTFAPQAPEPALEGADAGPETPPSEPEGDDPEAELPPIDPPRSWSKEDKELFNALPRETQQRVAERESARESDFRQRQNEAAEKSKALEAKEKAAEEARQQYETAAQRTLSILQAEIAKDFGDIRSIADVQRLANEDPFRFAQFQARQMQLSAQAQEVDNLQRQKVEESQKRFDTWSKEQDDAFAKQFPEFADKEKAGPVRQSIVSYLTETVGVPEDALPNLWKTELFRDAKFQRIIYDASRFHAAQAKAKAAVAVPKPAPQRPGVAPAKGSQFQEQIEAAQQRLTGAKGIAAVNAAAELMAARRRAAARR